MCQNVHIMWETQCIKNPKAENLHRFPPKGVHCPSSAFLFFILLRHWEGKAESKMMALGRFIYRERGKRGQGDLHIHLVSKVGLIISSSLSSWITNHNKGSESWILSLVNKQSKSWTKAMHGKGKKYRKQNIDNESLQFFLKFLHLQHFVTSCPISDTAPRNELEGSGVGTKGSLRSPPT